MYNKSLIHPLTAVAPLPQFELWSVPGTQVSVVSDIETDVRPLSTISIEQPIELTIQSGVDEYINLAETSIYIKARVNLKKKGDAALSEADWNSVVPVQNFLHSIFSSCEIKIGDKELSLAPQTYPYRAYIESLLAFSDEAKRSYLRGSMWAKEPKNRTKIIKPDTETDTHGKWFEMIGRLHLDLTFQEKNLVGGTELKIRLLPSDPRFYFQAGDDLTPSLEIAQLYLEAHKAKVTDDLLDSHTKVIARTPTRYPITRSEVKQQSIAKDSLDASLDNFIRGQIPRRMFVFMVDVDTFNGTFKSNPFSFSHNNLVSIATFIDGVQYPNKPYTPDFSKDLYMREYTRLFDVLNQNRTDTYCTISYEEFKSNSAIFAFNFAPDLSSGPGSNGHVSPILHGSLRLVLRFSQALAKPITVLAYCEFDNVIEIDANRNASTNYN